MVLCGLGMQQYAMHTATVQKTTFFEIGVCCLGQLFQMTVLERVETVHFITILYHSTLRQPDSARNSEVFLC